MKNALSVKVILFILLILPVLLLPKDKSLPSKDLKAKVEAYVQPYVQSNNFSGAILIANGDNILMRKAYGMANIELSVPNTPKTRFHVASISKSFTAAAIILLEQRGKLSTSDPLNKFIPDYPNGDQITIHHLLVHSSGIPNVNNFPDYSIKSKSFHNLDEIIDWFKHKPLKFNPGERYDYSNSNYNLLAKLIEKVSGETYGKFLKKNIFVPLGMIDTAHDGNTNAIIENRAYGYMPTGFLDLMNAPNIVWSIKTGNGSIYTTVDDLYKWDRSLNGSKLLNRVSRNKIFTDHINGVGYGWFIRKGKPRCVAINGRAPGFAASLERFIEDDICIVIVANIYSSIVHTMAEDLAAIVFGQERPPKVPVHPVKIDPLILKSYEGRYQFGDDFTFRPRLINEVKTEGNGIIFKPIEGGGVSFLIPLGKDRFLDRLYGGIVRFVKDAQGNTTHLIWRFRQDYKANRIKNR
jgi:CubicO group peptidase (beta-lactamase class C family)